MKIIKLKYIITLMIISVLQVQPGTAQNRVSGTDSPAALDAATLKGGGSVAVGTFVNKSGNSAFDYLETILPNALASALESKHNITTIKPRALADVLRKKILKRNLMIQIFFLFHLTSKRIFLFLVPLNLKAETELKLKLIFIKPVHPVFLLSLMLVSLKLRFSDLLTGYL